MSYVYTPYVPLQTTTIQLHTNGMKLSYSKSDGAYYMCIADYDSDLRDGLSWEEFYAGQLVSAKNDIERKTLGTIVERTDDRITVIWHFFSTNVPVVPLCVKWTL